MYEVRGAGKHLYCSIWDVSSPAIIGYDSHAPHIYSILPRSNSGLLSMRALWQFQQRDPICWGNQRRDSNRFKWILVLTIFFLEAEGTLYTARILAREDLNRQLVRSASCTIVIPEYELTLPASRGQLTTVEGLIRDVVADLSGDQPLRRIQDEASYNKIQPLIDSLKLILGDGDDEDDTVSLIPTAHKHVIPMPAFTIKLDDPTGNSFIEFIGSMADPKWNLRTYNRTRQQNIDLGFAVADETSEAATSLPAVAEDPIGDGEDANAEIFVFHGICSSCGFPLDTLMKKVSIPYFKVRKMLDILL